MKSEQSLLENAVKRALKGRDSLSRSDRTFAHIITRIASRGYHVYYTGLEELLPEMPREQNLIFSVNHGFEYDPFIAFAPIVFAKDKFISTLAKIETFRNPIYFLAMVGSRSLPVERGETSRKDLNTIVSLINQGVWLGICPEGTRTYSGYLGDFNPGLGLFYKKSDSDAVIPSIVTRDLVPKDGETAAFVNYGVPIAPKEKNTRHITQEIRNIQGQLTMLTVDNVASAYLQRLAETSMTNLVYEDVLSESLYKIMRKAQLQGYDIDSRLQIDMEKTIKKQVSEFLRYMHKKGIMPYAAFEPGRILISAEEYGDTQRYLSENPQYRNNINAVPYNLLESDKVLLSFREYMEEHFKDTDIPWQGEHLTFTSNRKHKTYAEGYVKANPVGYLSNTIAHLQGLKEIIRNLVN